MNRTMTGEELRNIRQKLGYSQDEMSKWFNLNSDGRLMRSWESGRSTIPGTAVKCLELAGLLEVNQIENE